MAGQRKGFLMLSTADINRELDRIAYKPGFTFKAYDDQWEGQKIRIQAEVPDAYNPDETVTLGIDSFLPPLLDEWEVRRWLMWRLLRIENHEAREFFRLDGNILWDPHR
jgi:hypothetical protein